MKQLLILSVTMTMLGGCTRAARSLPAPREFVYGSHPLQRFDLYTPERLRHAGTPLAILIHGGGWQDGSRLELREIAPEFIDRGFAVANVDYRLSGDAPAPAAAEDVRNAAAWIEAHCTEWNVDQRRIVLVGFSAGAHLALLAALAPDGAVGGPQSHPAAIVDFWGITDVRDLMQGARYRLFAERWLAGANDAMALAWRLSPLSYASRDGPPVLAFHSVFDTVVPFAHSYEFISRRQKQGSDARLVVLSYRRHAAPPEVRRDLFDRVFDFLSGLGFQVAYDGRRS